MLISAVQACKRALGNTIKRQIMSLKERERERKREREREKGGEGERFVRVDVVSLFYCEFIFLRPHARVRRQPAEL